MRRINELMPLADVIHQAATAPLTVLRQNADADFLDAKLIAEEKMIAA